MTARRRPTGATPDAIRDTLQQEWDSLDAEAPTGYHPDHSVAVAMVALALAVWREEA